MNDTVTSTDMVDIDQQLDAVKKELDDIEHELTQLNARKTKLNDLKEKLRQERIQRKTDQLALREWEVEGFRWSQEIRTVMRDVFNMSEFRPQQLRTINALMSGFDVLLLAPTGGGKSLCYQLPALASRGVTVVVSPLISLMEDQVWALKKIGVSAEMLSSATDKEKVKEVLAQLANVTSGTLKLLYVTPERLAKSKRFMTALQKCYNSRKLDRIAIDEVHCCSQWGHDFRPDYKFLAVLKTMFPEAPLLGVTATATAKVITDVQNMLHLHECLVFNASFNRPNLYYHVIEKPANREETFDMLGKMLRKRFHNQSGIIYTFSIKDAEELSVELKLRGVLAQAYHANLDSKKRTEIHMSWMNNEIQAVVATVAFGMGINKLDVRFVIHHSISKSMENFYQESGRAGRDGQRAECILMYRFQDMFKITTMMFTEYTGLKNAYSMIDYCINGEDCRRKTISQYFSEVWDEQGCDQMCDRCANRDKVSVLPIDVTVYYRTLVAITERADSMQMKLTALKLVDAWYHKGAPKFRVETPPPNLHRFTGEQIVAFLIIRDYLKEDFQFTSYAALSYIRKGSRSIAEGETIMFHSTRIINRLPKLNQVSNMNGSSTVNGKPKRLSKRKTLVAVESDVESVVSVTNGSGSSKITIDGATTEKERSPKNKKRKRTVIDHLEVIDTEDDDDVMIVLSESEVIEIDDN